MVDERHEDVECAAAERGRLLDEQPSLEGRTSTAPKRRKEPLCLLAPDHRTDFRTFKARFSAG
jgi:hypothetical protein